VVVEDDVVVSPFFLRFMNEALSYYRTNHASAAFLDIVIRCLANAGDILHPACRLLGLATWRDRWKTFNPDGRALLAELRRRGLTHAFDFEGAMGFTQMLEDRPRQNDSWAVRWHATAFE